MTPQTKPGTYGEAWINGPWLTTGDCDRDVLFVRVNSDGAICGKTHSPGDAVLRRPDSTWISLGPCDGNNAVAFGPGPTVYVSRGDGVSIYSYTGALLRLIPGYIGSQGIRDVRPDGSVISGDSTYGDGKVSEYTELSDGTRIGQGHDTGGVVAELPDGTCYQLWSGYAVFLHTHEANGLIVTCWTDFQQNYRLIYSLADVRALPPIEPPPPPAPPEPPVPVIDRNHDFATSTVTDAQLRQVIHDELASVNSIDDPEYWFTAIRQHPTPPSQNDWFYWKGRIDTGDGVGKGTGTTVPPASASLDMTVQQMITAALAPLSVQIAAQRAQIDGLKEQLANIHVPAVSLDGKHIALLAVNGKYVCADANHGDDRPLYGNRDDVGSWETFTVKEV